MDTYRHKSGEIFNQVSFLDYSCSINSQLEKEIGSENDDYILNVSEESYIESSEEKYKIELPEIYYGEVLRIRMKL